MNQHPKQLVFPKLIQIPDQYARLSLSDPQEKTVPLYRLDWSEVDEDKLKKHRAWTKGANIPFVPLLSPEWVSKLEDLKFAITQESRDNILHYTVLAQEESKHSQSLYLERTCAVVPQEAANVSFKLLFDCLWDTEKTYAGHKGYWNRDETGLLFDVASRIRFWDHQTGRELVSFLSGLEKLRKGHYASGHMAAAEIEEQIHLLMLSFNLQFAQYIQAIEPLKDVAQADENAVYYKVKEPKNLKVVKTVGGLPCSKNVVKPNLDSVLGWEVPLQKPLTSASHYFHVTENTRTPEGVVFDDPDGMTEFKLNESPLPPEAFQDKEFAEKHDLEFSWKDNLIPLEPDTEKKVQEALDTFEYAGPLDTIFDSDPFMDFLVDPGIKEAKLTGSEKTTLLSSLWKTEEASSPVKNVAVQRALANRNARVAQVQKLETPIDAPLASHLGDPLTGNHTVRKRAGTEKIDSITVDK